MSPHESPGPGSLTEVGPQQTTAEINRLLDAGFEYITYESLWDLAVTTIRRCDDLARDIETCNDLTYETVLAPLDEIDDMVIQVGGLLSLASMLHPNQDVRKSSTKICEAFFNDANDYAYSSRLRNKMHSFSRTEESDNLGPEEARYHDAILDWFEIAGGDLPYHQKKEVRKLNVSLLKLEGQFETNISEDKTVAIFDDEQVAGLDEQARRQYLTRLDDGRYALSMVDSSYNGFLTLASNREARRIAYETYNTRVKEENGKILQRIQSERQRLAKLLGYKSWLDLGQKFNVVNSPADIIKMYADVIGPITARAKREVAVMEKMLEADGQSGPLQEYDWRYYEEKLLQEKYGAGMDKAKEYFPLDAVLRGSFELTGQLFGLNYQPSKAKTWHPDVFAVEVLDQSSAPVGTIFFDLFPRDGKYKHFCTLPLSNRREMADGLLRLPSAVVIANIPKPTGQQPALLSQKQRVDVAFHEFGHALHHILGKSKLSSFGAMATEIDFVEIPSQLMESWAWDRDIIKRDSSHYETGEPMPNEMVELLIESQNINPGIRYLRSISLALFDLSLHNTLKPVDIGDKWSQAVAVSAFPEVPGTFFPAIFDHIASDYGGAYYSYFYDEFFCADIFERFEREGLTDNKLGTEYREKILEPGATKFGIDMIREFLGREPNKNALLQKLGKVMVAEA